MNLGYELWALFLLINSCISTSGSMAGDAWNKHTCCRELSWGCMCGIQRSGERSYMWWGGGENEGFFFFLLPQHFGTSFIPPIHLNGVIYFWVDQRFWPDNPIRRILCKSCLSWEIRPNYHITVLTYRKQYNINVSVDWLYCRLFDSWIFEAIYKSSAIIRC